MKGVLRVKAGALQFVVFIGAVIAVMLLCFVLLFHAHDLFDRKADLQIQLYQATENLLIQSFQKPLSPGEREVLELHELHLPVQQVTITSDYWGVFEKRSVSIETESQLLKKSALIGHFDQNTPALVLQDRRRPLILAGETLIKGSALIPEAGVRLGSINGQSYNRDKFIYGNTGNSSPALPQWNRNLLNELGRLTGSEKIKGAEPIAYKGQIRVLNSFEAPTQLIQGKTVRLGQIELAGNVIIWATDQIIVENEALLRDVLLVAPHIEIRDGVQGYFQALASRQISVGKDCRLLYPSALVVLHKAPSTLEGFEEPLILVNPHSEVKGVVATSAGYNPKPKHPDIRIDPSATVLGELYCSGSIELKGEVRGSVISSGFLALENGNIYQNHIYNGTIDATQLSDTYTGWMLHSSDAPRKIMKWLY